MLNISRMTRVSLKTKRCNGIIASLSEEHWTKLNWYFRRPSINYNNLFSGFGGSKLVKEEVIAAALGAAPGIGAASATDAGAAGARRKMYTATELMSDLRKNIWTELDNHPAGRRPLRHGHSCAGTVRRLQPGLFHPGASKGRCKSGDTCCDGAEQDSSAGCVHPHGRDPAACTAGDVGKIRVMLTRVIKNRPVYF